MNYLTATLKLLDDEVKGERRPTVVEKLHHLLSKGLREMKKKSSEFRHPTPNWDAYPLGRDHFLQHYR